MSRFFTSLALSAAATLAPDAVLRTLRDVCGSAPVEATIAMPALRQTEQGFVLTVNGIDVAVVSLAMPLPLEAFDAAASGTILWKEAKENLRKSKAHVVVATLQELKSHQEALSGAFAVTVVTAAVIRRTRAIGVVFNPAQTAFSAQDFHDMAVDLAQRQQIPEMLWVSIDFLLGPKTAAGQPTVGVSTMGLFPFIGREIEFEPVPWQPGAVAQRVLGLCQYLILNGPVIGDGDVVGNTVEEKLRVIHAQGTRLPVPVLKISAGTEGT